MWICFSDVPVSHPFHNPSIHKHEKSDHCRTYIGGYPPDYESVVIIPAGQILPGSGGTLLE